MKILRILSFAALAVLLTQCYPEGPEYIEELDLVYSNYDAEYDFTARKTYAIPDRIMKIDDDLINGEDPNFVKEPYATQLLDKIKVNMATYNWDLVDKDENPDVVIAPVAYMLTTTYYYGGYWGGWYGGWYGWYYPYPVTTSYTTGSLIMNMLDPNDLSPDDKARVVWTGLVSGLLEGSSSTFTARYTKGIDQAFTQSPYLNK